MKTIISIFGPTASGKTSFALKLAEQALFIVDKNLDSADQTLALESTSYSGVDIISADSRQVYKGLEVLTGADIPEGFVAVVGNTKSKDGGPQATSTNFQFPFWQKGKINLHGVSIIDPEAEWSVVHFKNFAIKIIKNSFKNNRLPIIVGGTVLYIDNLFNQDQNLYVAPDQKIRDKAEKMDLVELQNWLKKINQEKYESMNNSDINNPRRLTRAIEISLGKTATTEGKSVLTEINNLPDDLKNIKIGLELSLKEQESKIFDRVSQRFVAGAVNEVKNLNKICQKQDLPVCSTLGVSEISAYLNKEIDQETCIKNWALHEFQYSKRQRVWLKKTQDVVWLDDLNKSSYTLVDEKISIH